MKKFSILAATAIALCSCSATKTIGPNADLNGEWNIIEVNGSAIDTTKTEFRPTLGFEIEKNNVYGCAGCNSINGIARINTAKQTINFKEIGTTLMLCANMDYEQQILKALETVKAYKGAEDGRIDLTNSNGKTVLTLEKQTK